VTDVSPHPPEDEPPPTVPAAPVDHLRERLLAAAATVFARQGYEGTKILDVVRESGLSTGAVYGRFRSKNDLLREAVVTRAANAASFLDVGTGRVADLITEMAVNTDGPLLDFEAMRVEAYVTARREPEVAGAIADAYEAWRGSMAGLVDEARRDGTLAADVDPSLVLFFVRILSLGLLLHRGSGAPSPDPDAWAAFVDRLLGSFGDPSVTATDDPLTVSPEVEDDR
jgi:AcrR family transcriptional regulator